MYGVPTAVGKAAPIAGRMGTTSSGSQPEKPDAQKEHCPGVLKQSHSRLALTSPSGMHQKQAPGLGAHTGAHSPVHAASPHVPGAPSKLTEIVSRKSSLPSLAPSTFLPRIEIVARVQSRTVSSKSGVTSTTMWAA